MRLTDLPTDSPQHARIAEILASGRALIADFQPDPAQSGFLRVDLDPDDAEMLGIIPELSVAPNGSIAQDTHDQPPYFRSFAELLQGDPEYEMASADMHVADIL